MLKKTAKGKRSATVRQFLAHRTISVSSSTRTVVGGAATLVVWAIAVDEEIVWRIAGRHGMQSAKRSVGEPKSSAVLRSAPHANEPAERRSTADGWACVTGTPRAERKTCV
jgi:hypothetical protein